MADNGRPDTRILGSLRSARPAYQALAANIS